MRAMHRTCLVACLSMPFTVLVFVGIGRWMELSGRHATGGAATIAVFVVLAVFALAATVGAWYARKAVERYPLSRLAQFDSAAAQWDQDPVAPADAVLGGLYVGAIVAFALGEIGAVLGFAFFVMGGGWLYFGLLVVPSLVAWIMNLPRQEDWRARIDELEADPTGGGA